MGFWGEIVREQVEQHVAKNATKLSSKLTSKAYGWMAGKATDVVCEKTTTKIEEIQNKKLLARNPQNGKLILTSGSSNDSICAQDANGDLKYTIKPALFSKSRWYILNQKHRRVGEILDKSSEFKQFFHKKEDPKDYKILIRGQELGYLKTRRCEYDRVGQTTFNDWQIKNDSITLHYAHVADLTRAKFVQNHEYILDFLTSEDECLILAIIFAYHHADKRKFF